MKRTLGKIRKRETEMCREVVGLWFNELEVPPEPFHTPILKDPFTALEERKIENDHRGAKVMWVELQEVVEIDGCLDLSRFCAAPRARLSHLPLKSDGAFPAQC
jgi:hypothetical protein